MNAQEEIVANTHPMHRVAMCGNCSEWRAHHEGLPCVCVRHSKMVPQDALCVDYNGGMDTRRMHVILSCITASQIGTSVV